MVCAILSTSFSIWGQDTSTVKGNTLLEVPVVQYVQDQLIAADISHSGPRYVLQIDQLDKLALNDIGDAMKYVPGVQIKDYGGIGGIKTISYRSLSGHYTSVQLDHMPVSNIQTGVLNLTSFQLMGVSSIEFTSGQPANDLSMPSSYLSVNNIAIRSRLFAHPDSLNLEVLQQANSINAYRSGLYMAVPFSNKWHLGVNVLARYGSGEYSFIYPKSGSYAEMRRTNSSLFSTQARVVIGYSHKHLKIQLSGSVNENQQQLPGAVILYNPSNNQELSNQDKDFSLQYQWKGKKWNVSSNAFYRNNYTHYFDPEYLNQKGYLSSNYEQRSGGGGIMFSRILSTAKEKIFSGVDIVQAKLHSDQFSASPQRTNINMVVGVSKWLKKIKIDANVCGQIVLDETFELDSNIDRSFNKLSPFIAVAYLPFKKQRFRIRSFYKHTYRVPSFNDLYYNFIGNTNLRPENAHVINAGLTFAKDFGSHRMEIIVDGYYTAIEDKILAIPTKDLFNWSMQNIGKTTAVGLDFSISSAYSSADWRWVITVNQNINSTTDISSPLSSSYQHQIPYTPKVTSSVSLLPSWKGYGLSVNGIYSGKRYALNENIPVNLLDPFVDFSLGLEKEFDFGRAALWCSAKVMNLLGKNYEVIRSFPMPGRYYQLTLKFKYK